MADFADLDRTVTIQRATPTANAFNEPVEAWEDFAVVAASKRDVSDREKLAAAELGASITTRFVVRWSPKLAQVTPKYRLVCEGVTYDISGKKEIGRREGYELTATARAE